MKPHIILFVFLLFSFSVLIGPVYAITYYVEQNNPSCNDSGSGAEIQPWCTFQRATHPRGTDIVAGDTVYVKNGTYRATDDPCTPGNSARPGFRPVNSGTATAPIAFRVYPGHTAVVSRNTCVGYGNAPVVGMNGQSYIIWDGFTTAQRNDVGITNATGGIIENMYIDKGPPAEEGSNYNGIFIDNGVTNLIIRNNTIKNVYWPIAPHRNAAGITLYRSSNVSIYNNEFYSSNAGIFDKQKGNNNTYELNYFADVQQAIYFSANCAGPTCPVEHHIIRNNIIVNSTDAAITLNLDPAANPVRDFGIYNNVIYNVRDRGGDVRFQVPEVGLYNNIITTSSTGFEYSFGGGVPSDLLSNYNDFRRGNGPDVQMRVMGNTETFSQWQSRGHDPNSLTVDPQFVGPLTGTPRPEAFKLQSTSPLRGAGREGGVSSGAPVDMGAYPYGNECIGAGCPPRTCGNGIVDSGEQCDGSNLNGRTCQSLGYSGGTLSCSSSCAYDTSQCIASDTTPPVRSNGQPTGTLSAGTTQTTMSLNTNEAATCRYSTTSNTQYSSMTNTYQTTGGTSHSTLITDLQNGTTYNYYNRCQDTAGNANTDDYLITFSVASTPMSTENWNCTEWGACVNNQQNRTCTDLNNCGTTANRPPETQSCTSAQNQTCRQQNGDVCTSPDTCQGTLLNASDTNFCCSVQCIDNNRGDITDDRIVNVFDLTFVGSRFGQRPGDSRWDEKADDCTEDSVIDVADLDCVSANMAKTY